MWQRRIIYLLILISIWLRIWPRFHSTFHRAAPLLQNLKALETWAERAWAHTIIRLSFLRNQKFLPLLGFQLVLPLKNSHSLSLFRGHLFAKGELKGILLITQALFTCVWRFPLLIRLFNNSVFEEWTRIIASLARQTRLGRRFFFWRKYFTLSCAANISVNFRNKWLYFGARCGSWSRISWVFVSGQTLALFLKML